MLGDFFGNIFKPGGGIGGGMTGSTLGIDMGMGRRN